MSKLDDRFAAMKAAEEKEAAKAKAKAKAEAAAAAKKSEPSEEEKVQLEKLLAGFKKAQESRWAEQNEINNKVNSRLSDLEKTVGKSEEGSSAKPSGSNADFPSKEYGYLCGRVYAADPDFAASCCEDDFEERGVEDKVPKAKKVLVLRNKKYDIFVANVALAEFLGECRRIRK